jgi:hypothetical protein
MAFLNSGLRYPGSFVIAVLNLFRMMGYPGWRRFALGASDEVEGSAVCFCHLGSTLSCVVRQRPGRSDFGDIP